MVCEFTPLVYQVASISKLFWQEYVNCFEDAQTVLKLGESKLFAFPSFTLEVFHRLYYESEPQKLDPPPPESAWAERLHDEFLAVIESDRALEQCQGNQLAAGIATVEYCRLVYEKLPLPRPQFANPQRYRDTIRRLKQLGELPTSQALSEAVKDILQQQQQPYEAYRGEDASPHASTDFTQLQQPQPQHGTDSTSPIGQQPKLQQQQLIEQWLNQLGVSEAPRWLSGVESDYQLPELLQLLQREGREAVQLAQEYATSLEETQIRQMLRAALAAANQKLEEAAGWLDMMGLSWDSQTIQDTQVSPAQKMALFQKIASNSKLKQIAKLAGRFKDMQERKRRSKAKDSFGEITTIELGNNLSRLLPSELQKLSEEALFPLFAKGYYDRSLLQYKTSGKEKQSRGPLVVCLDSSGSMSGLPDDWAKAITAVLGQIANQEYRLLRVIHFATEVCRIDDFFPKQHDYQKLLESMLAFYNGGGTQWEPALKAAMECIEHQQHLKRADVVMVTDGKCDLEWELLTQLRRKKQQLEFTVYGVLIGEGSANKLKKFCDRVWTVKDLVSDEMVIEELFLL